jgi:hypothetical protein
MNIEVIKATEAPVPPKKVSKVAQEVVLALQALKKDEVLKISPEADKSIRGLKTSIGRISSNAGIKVESYDEGGFVYVKKL